MNHEQTRVRGGGRRRRRRAPPRSARSSAGSVHSKARSRCISGPAAISPRRARAALAAPLSRRGFGAAASTLAGRPRLSSARVACQRSKPSVARLSARCGGKLGGDVDLAAVRRVDPQPPRMEMELAADPAGQERLGPAIFAHRRRSDGRSPPCARAAGGCARSAAAARPRRRGCRRGRCTRQRVLAGRPCSSSMCIFSPPVPGCLASGASIMPSSPDGTPTTSAQ